MERNAQDQALAAMGREIGPDVVAAVQALFRQEQQAHADAMPVGVADARYGNDPRQALDLYLPRDMSASARVLLWVHGGGFVRGEKRSEEHPYNAHIGRWAARNGMVGAVMNYRLAPAHHWPAGAEDVGLALDWLRVHIAEYGGDPARIVLAGTSAGAIHIATHLRLRSDPGVAGAILLSGLYGFTPLDDRDTAYYGPAEHYPERWPRDAVVATELPLLVAGAEYDPPRFQREWIDLLAARLERHRVLPGAFFGAGHNHYSFASHIGGNDTRLSDAMLDFIHSVTGPQA